MEDSTVLGRYLRLVNELDALKSARIRSGDQRDCWIFNLDDGPHCFNHLQDNTVRAEPFTPRAQPATGCALAANALGDVLSDIGADITVSQELVASDITCATFFTRRLNITSADVSLDYAYRIPHRFVSGFACEKEGEISSWWVDTDASYGTEDFFTVWDVLLWEEDTFVILDRRGCSGECQYLVVHQFLPGKSPKVFELLIWHM